MIEIDFSVCAFLTYFFGYYCRALFTLHRARCKQKADTKVLDTWRLFFSSKTVLKNAASCALFSMAVFLGITIANDPMKQETDEYREGAEPPVQNGGSDE